ncbi:MAG: hypothetical protein PSV23_04430 [Brevundimonas sp.]|uniref:hypothetical protein n=1 Tax=Brevundimonas sp. TaxID=1871086 RepID=UPI00248891B5|nr:hypothetical protein [Brevundimonas sp.]MDI1326029.1 hypothetical protein [Brevundimonas sp.]
MLLNRRGALGLAALAAAPKPSALTPGQASALPDPEEIIRLWPGTAPGGEAVTVTPRVVERSTDPTFHDRFAQYTTDPLMMVIRPEQPNGASLLLIPGGGYRWAVVDKEGLDCARRFAAAGVTCFILRYRLPAAGVRTEMHLFEEGGHGFGIRLIAGRPAAVWPELVLAWGARHGWITRA